MPSRTRRIAVGAAVLAATAFAFAPAAHAGGVGFNVAIGGPGYAVSFGNAPYWGHRHYYAPYRPYWGPAYVAPPVVYVAPPPRVIYRAPYVRYPVVVREPVYYRY